MLKRLIATPVALLLLLPVTVSAQGKEKDHAGATWLLFSDKGIEKEFKLKPGELEQAQKVVEEVTDRFQEELERARKIARVMPEVAREVRRKAKEETYHALAKVLTKAQVQRLEQIDLQVYGLSILLRPAEGQDMKLTDEQIDKIHSLNRKTLRKDLSRQQSLDLRREMLDEALKVLDSDQRKRWDALVGPRYEVKLR